MHRKLMFQTQHLATPGVAVHRKLMFHAQFSGITGELYAAGPRFSFLEKKRGKETTKGACVEFARRIQRREAFIAGQRPANERFTS